MSVLNETTSVGVVPNYSVDRAAAQGRVPYKAALMYIVSLDKKGFKISDWW
jgi:hypothetical protein